MAIRNVTTASNTGDGPSSQVINAPTNLAGDIIVLAATCQGSATLPEFTWPSGFSSTAVSAGDTSPFYGGNNWVGLAWKVSSGSEPTTYTVGMGEVVNSIDMICASFSGRNATQFTAQEATNGAAGHGVSSFTTTLTGLTAAAGDDVAAFYVATSKGWAIASPPSGYTTEATTAGTTSLAQTLALCVAPNVAAGATGSLAASLTGGTDGDGFGIVVSLAAAASSGNGSGMFLAAVLLPFAWIIDRRNRMAREKRGERQPVRGA